MGATAGIRMKRPAHPGGFVKHEIIEPLELSVTAAAQALGACAQVEDELRHVALHLLDALAQAVGRRGHVRHVLAGLGLRRGADLLRAALGRLDDRLHLIAGLRRQRPRARRLDAAAAAARRDLGDEFDVAWAEGAALDDQRAITLAVDLTRPAHPPR